MTPSTVPVCVGVWIGGGAAETCGQESTLVPDGTICSETIMEIVCFQFSRGRKR